MIRVCKNLAKTRGPAYYMKARSGQQQSPVKGIRFGEQSVNSMIKFIWLEPGVFLGFWDFRSTVPSLPTVQNSCGLV